jgi:hypothetical protein
MSIIIIYLFIYLIATEESFYEKNIIFLLVRIGKIGVC